MKYGIEGYGLYFACIEIIANKLATDNISFELEHDAEILAHKFKVDTIKVEKIMKYCIELGLFAFNPETKRVLCLQLAKRLDVSTSNNIEFKRLLSSDEFRKLIETNSNYQKVLPTNSRREEKRIQEKRIDNKTKCEYSKSFEHFWTKYPQPKGRVKGDKQKTSKLFEKINSKYLVGVGKALDNYIKSDVVKKGMITNAQKWIANWDEYLTISNSSGGKGELKNDNDWKF